MDPVVILSSDTVAVGPGQEARLPVRVRNQGRRVESYRVEVVGAPSAFARVDPSTVSVLPGREAEVDVWFNPPAGASTPTGALPFAVRATSEVDASSSAAAEGHIELSGVAGLQAWCANTSRKARWKANFPLEFANHGNAAVRLAVVAHDPSGEVRITVSDEVVDLQPGGRATSNVTAKVRQPFLRGNAVNRIIQARCQSLPFGAERPEPGAAPPPDDPNSRTFQLTMVQRPILSKIVVLAAVLLIGLLAALVVLQLRGGDEVALGLAAPEAPPEFTAEPQGSSVIFLQWTKVPNAVGYEVRETTEEGEATGAAIGELDAATLNFPVEDLEPGSQHCYAVVAVGPEGAGNSRPSTHECATTGAASQLPQPTGLQVTPLGGGTFELIWEYPPTEDVQFRVLVGNAEQPTPITGSPTTVVLLQRDAPYPERVSVLAVRGEERSDPAEAVVVEVEALPPPSVPATVDATPVPVTTLPLPPGQTLPLPPGQTTLPPTATTVTTTPTTTPTTTGAPGPAQEVIADLTGTWAAIFDPAVLPPPAGFGVEAATANLAARLAVDPAEIESFSNRDTIATDENGQPSFGETNVTPDTNWLYRPAANRRGANQMCSAVTENTCRARFVEGAAAAAARTGATVVVLGTFPGTTSIAELDAALETRRDALGRATIYILDGADYEGFAPGEVVMYVSTTPSEVGAICAAIAPEPCPPPVVLVPRGG
jgi:hypothetical protein